MKILFVTQHYLDGKGGGTFASKAYINAFARNATQMKLLYPIKKDEKQLKDIDESVSLCPVSYSKPKLCKLVDLIIGRVHRYYHIIPQLLKNEKCTAVFSEKYGRSSYGLILLNESEMLCSKHEKDVKPKLSSEIMHRRRRSPWEQL